MTGLESSLLPSGYVAGFMTAVIVAGMIRLGQWALSNPVVESAVAIATAPMFSIVDAAVAVLLVVSFYTAIVYGPRVT